MCISLLSRGRSDDPAGVGKAVWVIKSPVSSVLGGLEGTRAYISGWKTKIERTHSEDPSAGSGRVCICSRCGRE